MNFKRFYINGNKFSIFIIYRDKGFDIGIEHWWNIFMWWLTKITTKQIPIVKPEESTPPIPIPYPKPRKFHYSTKHNLFHLSKQTTEQAKMTFEYTNWILSQLKDPHDIAIYSIQLNNIRLRVDYPNYWYSKDDELIRERKEARKIKDFKTSDIIRNILDSRLVFVFDTKDNNGNPFQETYWLYDEFFHEMDFVKFKTRRSFVEYKIGKVEL